MRGGADGFNLEDVPKEDGTIGNPFFLNNVFFIPNPMSITVPVVEEETELESSPDVELPVLNIFKYLIRISSDI